MEHSVTKIMGKQSFTILFSILMLFSINSANSQNNDLVVKYNYKQTNEEHKVRERNAFSDMQIEYRGDIHVSDNDQNVISISPGGFLKIYKKTFGNKRGIEIRATQDKLIFDYYLGRKKVDFEPEGRRWLAEILPEVIRKTGIDAKRRTLRIYKSGGVLAVLDEIELLGYDDVKSKYYRPLLNFNDLSSENYVKIAVSIDHELSYDSSKRKWFIR